MQDKTDEFSFLLKQSKHGVGVFAVHDIKKGTYLRLFGDERTSGHRAVTRKKKDIPVPFRSFCIDRGEEMLCPPDFSMMPIGWHLNHSKEYNALHRNLEWYAARDITEGEEILIDYNSLEEPEKAKEDFYRA